MKKIFFALLVFTFHFSPFTKVAGQTFPTITQFELPNKLKVYLIPFGNIEATQVTLYINVGKKNEIPGQQYYSQIVANSLGLGCEKYSRDSLQDELFKMGTGMSAISNENFTTISSMFLTSELDHGMDIFSSVITKPLFPDEDLKQEISQLVDFNNLDKLDISQQAAVFSDFWIYGGENPLGRYFYKDQLIKITPAVLKEFYSFNYTPGNSRLVLCGKFDATQVKLLVEKYFASWNAPYGEANGVNFSELPIKKKEIGFVNRNGATQAALQWNKIGPEPFTHDADLFRLANFTFNQILFKEIREHGGKTYGIRSSYDQTSGSPVFSVTTQVRVEETMNTIKLFDQVLQDFYNNGITETQLKNAKTNFRKSITGIDNPSSMTAFFNPLLYSNSELRKNYLSLLDKVTIEEINKMIKKYFTPDSYKLMISGNESDVSKQFLDWNSVKKFTSSDLIGL